MKKFLLLTFVIFSMTTINSCQKEKEQEPIPNQGVTAEKTNVKTYEIINLITQVDLIYLESKYSATFGSVAIELFKTSDSTLTFYIPDIAQGEASLRFELAEIKFVVTKTADVNPNELITGLTENFDLQVSLLSPSTTDEIAEINSIKQYKQEVILLFNSLTKDEKRQASLFYDANKEVFKSFAKSSFANLDASTTMKRQSECPRTDFQSFYGCTAQNLGDAAIGLKKSSIEFLTMLTLAGVSAYLAPASFGLSAIGTTLALGTAGYLLITEVKPAVLRFKHSLFPFLEANWIFTGSLFRATTEVFKDQVSTSLNLKPAFRSLTSNDGYINSGSGYLISSMVSLREHWNKLTSIFGNFPAYMNTEASTTLASNEVSISNISNKNVQYIENKGQSVTFKSISEEEETFSYNLRVSKEGFTEQKILNGKVLASDPCANGSASPPVITNVQVVCNSDNLIAILVSFTANGKGALISTGSQWCDIPNICYPVRLYMRHPGTADYDIAHNSYNVILKSGNSNAGVIEIKFVSSASCINGQSAAQSLQSIYPNYEWKVELMNQCNQRSNQVKL